MTDSNATQKASYPLPAYNFQVTVGAESASFTEASGLAAEYETVTYRHGLSRWEGESVARFPKLGHTTVTLKKGTTSRNTFLWDWLTADPPVARIGDPPAAPAIAISLCDEAGAPVVVWHIKEAIPVKLAAPGFDVASNQVAIETLELLASGISVEHV
jgi:phage tail-like protein